MFRIRFWYRSRSLDPLVPLTNESESGSCFFREWPFWVFWNFFAYDFFCNKHLPGTILFYLGLHCAEEPAKAPAPLPSESATENLDDLIQMSADLDLAGRPLPGPAALGGGPDATWRPRHTSSSSDISSEGKLVSSNLVKGIRQMLIIQHSFLGEKVIFAQISFGNPTKICSYRVCLWVRNLCNLSPVKKVPPLSELPPLGLTPTRIYWCSRHLSTVSLSISFSSIEKNKQQAPFYYGIRYEILILRILSQS